MAESESHKRAKSKAAGKSGKTEVPISRGRRLDATTKNKAIEVERSGTNAGLEKAAKRLKDSKKIQRVLIVPNTDLRKAAEAMKKLKVTGTVKNMSGTKRISIVKKRK